MNILMLPIILLGPIMIIASFFSKKMFVRIFSTLGGVVLMVGFTYNLTGIRYGYEHDHRTVENQYHRVIIKTIDTLLKEGEIKKARNLTGEYLDKTIDASFTRNSLYDLVQSIQKKKQK